MTSTITSANDPDDWFLLARDKLAAADDVFAARGATYVGVELLHNLTQQFFAQHYLGSDLADVGANYTELRTRITDLIQLIES